MNAESAKLFSQKSENEVGENAPVGIYLVGAGVVGSAVLQAHLDAGVSVWLADQDENAVVDAVRRVRFSDAAWRLSGIEKISGAISAIHFQHRDAHRTCQRTLVIESIVEKLDIKQAFFREAEQNQVERQLCQLQQHMKPARAPIRKADFKWSCDGCKD